MFDNIRNFFSYIICLILLAILNSGLIIVTNVLSVQAASQILPIPAANSQAATQSCPAITVANNQGISGRVPQQFELNEFETQANCTLTFAGNPDIETLYAQTILGVSLPPVAERLPAEPLVVVPYTSTGSYGGTLHGVSIQGASIHSGSQFGSEGTDEIRSWRQVNLVRFADDLHTIVPDVAKGWAWNANYTELTLYLRPGHKWSDGAPFTSDDILFWYYDLVRNEEIYPDAAARWLLMGGLMEVVAPDTTTVQFRFRGPLPGFLVLLATLEIQPFQPKQYLSKYHNAYNPNVDELVRLLGFAQWQEMMRCYYHEQPEQAACGRAPTLNSHLKAAETPTSRRYVANPYFHQVDTAGQQLPYIAEHRETIVRSSAALQQRIAQEQVDHKITELSATDYTLYQMMAGNERVGLVSLGSEGMVYYTLNQTHRDHTIRNLFIDVRFRQALSLAINRSVIAARLYSGYARPMQATPGDVLTVPFVTEDAAAYMTAYDPEQANQLLDAAGLTQRDGDGFRLLPTGYPLTIRLFYPEEAGPPAIHEMIARDWEAVGVRVLVRPTPLTEYRTMTRANQHDIAVWNYDGITYPDIATMIKPIRYVPPFGDRDNIRTGQGWVGWHRACVHWEHQIRNCPLNNGIIPPNSVKSIWDIVARMRGLDPSSNDWVLQGNVLTRHYQENLYHIGTVGNFQGVQIINPALQNVPEFPLASKDYLWGYPYRVTQWYFR